MIRRIRQAELVLKKWKKGSYLFGLDILKNLDCLFWGVDKNAILVVNPSEWLKPYLENVLECFNYNGIKISSMIRGAEKNSPLEDAVRIGELLAQEDPGTIFVFGSGSTIDATKAGLVMAVTGSKELDPYYGMEKFTQQIKTNGNEIPPIIAIQTTASSASHLTQKAFIANFDTGNRNMICDDALIPQKAVFDYATSIHMHPTLTLDGALNAFSQCWEVFMNANGKSFFKEIQEVTEMVLQLIITALPKVVKKPHALEPRYHLGLATDLGGYATVMRKYNKSTKMVDMAMLGGGHIGSLQLMKFLSHGRACSILNPYYAMLFANYVEKQNVAIGKVLQEFKFIPASTNFKKLKGRQLAETTVNGVFTFLKTVAFPRYMLNAGIPREQIQIMLAESKSPQFAMHLQNLPVPLDPDKGDIEKYMAPTLKAAYFGDLTMVPEIP